MSHFLTVPINENGLIIDQNIDIEIGVASASPFRFTDVFIYSHGWWTTATNALAEYNLFSIGFSKVLQNLVAASPQLVPHFNAGSSALSTGVHWPSMISEDQDAVANFFEAMSFFTMEHRADAVGDHGGYALLRLLLDPQTGARNNWQFNLIGHSFGCRVICSALQALAKDAVRIGLAKQISFRVALLQAASDNDSLVKGQLYGDVLSTIPNLRLLVTTSQLDTALGKWYPAAQDLAHLFSNAIPAMGATGPTGALFVPVSHNFQVQPGVVPVPQGPFAVADLTPLHRAHAAAWGNAGGWGGQHSDINLPEIYELLSKFFGA